MKRKLSCLILSALMLLSSVLLCSCPASTTESGTEGEEETATNSSTSRNPMTLSLWIPTDESTTSAAISQVEAAINKITQAKYNTAIEFRAIASDKYEETVKDHMEEIKEIQTRTEEEERAKKAAEREARKKGETIAETTEVTTETALETAGEATSVVYPSVTSTQMDIFLIRGYEDFTWYADEVLLSSLDDELNGSCKLMKSYIYPSFLQMATVYDATYAIPNSHPIGEYTYLLINKELCDNFYYDPESFDSVLACEDFIYDVAQNSDVTPLLSPVEATGLTYWGNDNGDFSVLATVIPDEQDVATRLNIRNIFGLSAYVDTTTMMKKLKEAGHVGNGTEKEFGVGVITGTAADIEEYEEDYYVNVIRRPRATNEDIYQAMFAVSSYTKDVRRSTEIINLINTDTEFRTLLQYGVEGVHWAIDEESPVEDPYIKILNDEYKMTLEETGNVFITYPAEGVPMSAWDDAIQQNLDSEIDPLVRFVGYVDEDNKEYFDELYTFSADVAKRVDAMTASEFEAAIETLKEEVTNSDPYVYLTDDAADGYESLIMKYSDYHGDYFAD